MPAAPIPATLAPRIVLFGQGAVGRELAAGLEQTGARVVVVGPDAAVPCALTSLDEGRDALARADAQLDGIDALIWAWVDPRAGQPTPLLETSFETWTALAEEPLHRILRFFQLAHGVFGADGGRIVLLVPSLAMTGAAGLVPWSSAAEGQRSIAKSVARKWGGRGITVNSLAVPAALLVPGEAEQALERPGLPPMSLPAPRLRVEVAALVAALLSPVWGAVTGSTIGADGGRWMTP